MHRSMKRLTKRSLSLCLPGLCLAVAVGGGCATSPNYTARFGMTPGQTFELKVDGTQPTVRLAPDFGPLERVDWFHADGVTTFNGVPAGGDLLLTLREGDSLRFTDQLGSRVEIKMWNSTGYTLTMVGEDVKATASSETTGR